MSKLLPVITYRAWSKINDILIHSQTNAMLYSAESGGCNGFNFKLDILDEVHKDTLDESSIQPTILTNNYK